LIKNSLKRIRVNQDWSETVSRTAQGGLVLLNLISSAMGFCIRLLRVLNKSVINAALETAKTLGGNEIIKKRTKKENDRVILVITFNPKLPSVFKIIKKQCITLTKIQPS
jgi:hypothetical protein